MVLLPAVLMLAGCGTGGSSSSVEIGENGNWIIDGVDSGVAATGKGIESVEKTGSEGKVDTYTITFTDGTTTTFTITNGEEPLSFDASGNTLTEDALRALQGKVALKGTFTDIAGDETATGFVSDMEVTFTDSGYHYYMNDPTTGTFTEADVFKIGGVPTLVSVDMQNELAFSPLTDSSSGEILGWDSFSNPFADLTVYDFEEVEDAPGTYRFRTELPHVQTAAIDFITKLTNYRFDGLDKVEFKLVDGKIDTVSYETPVWEAYYGYQQYKGELSVVAYGDDVAELEYPEVYEKTPEHEKLEAALTEINTEPIAVEYKSYEKSESTMSWDEAELMFDNMAYFTDDAYLMYDYYYEPAQVSGLVLIGEDTYEISGEGETLEKSFYPVTNSAGEPYDIVAQRGDFLCAAPELFTVVDDKHFEYTGTYAGVIAYYFDIIANPYSKFLTKVSIELDDNYKVKTITLTDDMFTNTTETFTAIGDAVELPVDLSTIPVAEDPFVNFVHTYTYVSEVDGASHSIVVKSLSDIKVDGVAATDIAFDGSSSVTFTCGGLYYDVYYSSYSKTFSVSIEDDADYYEYFSNSSFYDNLTVE